VSALQLSHGTELEFHIVARTESGAVLREGVTVRETRLPDGLDDPSELARSLFRLLDESDGWNVLGVRCSPIDGGRFRVDVECERKPFQIDEGEATMADGRVVTTVRKRYAVG
jgi:hypothetical protein